MVKYEQKKKRNDFGCLGICLKFPSKNNRKTYFSVSSPWSHINTSFLAILRIVAGLMGADIPNSMYTYEINFSLFYEVKWTG